MREGLEELNALLSSGVIGEPAERIAGKWVMGGFSFCFSPEQARAAAAAGVTVYPTAVDAVLEDPEARAEVIARLRDEL